MSSPYHPQFDPRNPQPAQPFAANPFAAPLAEHNKEMSTSPDGLWREGDQIVAAMSARFPNRCVKCNAPVARQIYQQFSWYNPWLLLLIIISPLILIIVALIMQKKASFYIGICDEHRKRKRNILLVVWLLVIPALMAGTILFVNQGQLFTLGAISFVLIIVIGFGALIVVRYLRPSKVTNTHAWLKGADESFLRELPQV